MTNGKAPAPHEAGTGTLNTTTTSHHASVNYITWAEFRALCAEVDRFKRERLREAQAARDTVIRGGASEDAVTAGLMGCASGRFTGVRAAIGSGRRSPDTADVGDTHIDRARPKRSTGEKRAAITESLRKFPAFSDREHGRRLNVDHKTVAAVRRHMESTGEISQSAVRVSGDGRMRPAAPAEGPKAQERQRESGRAFGRGMDRSGSAGPDLSSDSDRSGPTEPNRSEPVSTNKAA